MAKDKYKFIKYDISPIPKFSDYNSEVEFIKFIPMNYSENFKIPKEPKVLPEESANEFSKKERETKDRKTILSPLDEVFFEPELMDELIVRASVPQLLKGVAPLYQGVILYGPPGTGKSEVQKALCRVYDAAGAYAKQVSSSKINSFFVGQLASNLEKELETACKQGERRGLPSFLSFDEGSIFAEQAGKGANSVSKHYQEAIDVLKRYVGNDLGKWLVLAISTNSLPEDFEEALTREGRMTSFFIPPPSKKQIARMWKHFLSKQNVLAIDEAQAQGLAETYPGTTGALVSKFCEAYFAGKRNQLLVARGYQDLLSALKENVNLPDSEVRASITYDGIKEDLREYLEKQAIRENGNHKEKEPFGFAKGGRQ